MMILPQNFHLVGKYTIRCRRIRRCYCLHSSGRVDWLDRSDTFHIWSSQIPLPQYQLSSKSIYIHRWLSKFDLEPSVFPQSFKHFLSLEWWLIFSSISFFVSNWAHTLPPWPYYQVSPPTWSTSYSDSSSNSHYTITENWFPYSIPTFSACILSPLQS